MMIKRGIKKTINVIVLTGVFLLTGICVWGLYTAKYIPEEALLNHRDFWYPLQNCIESLIVSGLLIWKAFGLKSCAFTKVSVLIYSVMSLLCVIYMLTNMEYDLFLNIMEYFIIISFSLLILFFIISSWAKKYLSR